MRHTGQWSTGWVNDAEGHDTRTSVAGVPLETLALSEMQ